MYEIERSPQSYKRYQVINTEHRRYGLDIFGSIFEKPVFVGTWEECRSFIARAEAYAAQNV